VADQGRQRAAHQDGRRQEQRRGERHAVHPAQDIDRDPTRDADAELEQAIEPQRPRRSVGNLAEQHRPDRQPREKGREREGRRGDRAADAQGELAAEDRLQDQGRQA
jgi:hypothetical protein